MTDKEKLLDLLNDLKNLKRIDICDDDDEDGCYVYWDDIEDIIKKYEEK